MLDRQRASVEEWRVEGGMVDEVDERGRDGTRHGRREGGSERRKRGSKGGKLQGMYPEEGTDQYTVFTNHPTTRPLPLILCYYK